MSNCSQMTIFCSVFTEHTAQQLAFINTTFEIKMQAERNQRYHKANNFKFPPTHSELQFCVITA